VSRLSVLHDVGAERLRQDGKWGEQNHPDGTSARKYAGKRDFMRDLCNVRAARGTVSFLDILFEEVYEAAAEEDPVALREELLQVAAVAVAWIEAMDRRKRNA
jgi:hypothetical protein